MNEEYLWNRAGEPDPEITGLEQLLKPLAYRPNPETVELTAEKKHFRSHSRYWLWAGAAAAAMLLAGIGLSFRHRIPYTPRESAWKLSWNGAKPDVTRIG